MKAGQEWMVVSGHTGGPKEFYNLAKGLMDSGPSQSVYWWTLQGEPHKCKLRFKATAEDLFASGQLQDAVALFTLDYKK